MRNMLNIPKSPELPASMPGSKTTSAAQGDGGFDKVMQDRLEQDGSGTQDEGKAEDNVSEEVILQGMNYPHTVVQWMTTITDIGKPEDVPAGGEAVAEFGTTSVKESPISEILDASATVLAEENQGKPAESQETETGQLPEHNTNTKPEAVGEKQTHSTEKPLQPLTEAQIQIPKEPDRSAVQTPSTEVKADVMAEAEQSVSPREKTSNSQGDPPGMQDQDKQQIENAVLRTDVGRTMQPESPKTQTNVRAAEQTIRPEYIEKLGESVAKQLLGGRQELEIQLEPLHLGKMLVKVTYEAGKAAVSIICSEAKTMQAMSQNAKELGYILESHMGTQTEIIVDKGQPMDYLEQEQQNAKEQHKEQTQRDKSSEQDKEETDAVSFLQQLRLGLV